jgi:hypothetical protein
MIQQAERSGILESGEAIQREIDQCAKSGGGEVRLEPGVYTLRDSFHLRSGVRLTGQEGVVLTRAPSVQSALSIYCGYGLYEIAVQEPERFEIGQGIHVTDDHAGGFYDTVATIIGKEGDRLFLDRMLNHDYHPANNGKVSTLFPLISALDVENGEISNLVLDGYRDGTGYLNGCRGGGVFCLRSRRIRIEGVEVRNFHGDGISFQQCVDVTVKDCHVHHNAGTGLHPGSGSVRYVLENNNIHDNGGCGIYYCLRTTHSRCKGNRIERNGEVGISIGEMDTDHLITENTLIGNRKHGILFRRPGPFGGDRVRIEGNRFEENGVGEEGYSLFLHSHLNDIRIWGNTFDDASPLYVGPECHRIQFAENRVGNRQQASEDIKGCPEAVSESGDEAFPSLGPAALPSDGARHLGIARLEPWNE